MVFCKPLCTRQSGSPDLVGQGVLCACLDVSVRWSSSEAGHVVVRFSVGAVAGFDRSVAINVPGQWHEFRFWFSVGTLLTATIPSQLTFRDNGTKSDCGSLLALSFLHEVNVSNSSVSNLVLFTVARGSDPVLSVACVLGMVVCPVGAACGALGVGVFLAPHICLVSLSGRSEER